MEENQKIVNKKPILILVAIVLVAVVGFVLVGKYGVGLNSLPEGPVEPSGEAPGTGVQTPEQVNAFVREAIDHQDPVPCEGIKDNATKEWCKEQAIIADAMVKLDPSVCNGLNKEESKAVCWDSVIVNRAVVNKDPSLCDTLEDKTRVEPCKLNATPFVGE